MKSKKTRSLVRGVCALLTVGSMFAVPGCNVTDSLFAAVGDTANGLIQNVLDGVLGGVSGQNGG